MSNCADRHIYVQKDLSVTSSDDTVEFQVERSVVTVDVTFLQKNRGVQDVGLFLEVSFWETVFPVNVLQTQSCLFTR